MSIYNRSRWGLLSTFCDMQLTHSDDTVRKQQRILRRFHRGEILLPHHSFHSSRHDESTNPQYVSPSSPFSPLTIPADILRERPESPSPKTYAVSYMEETTNSFAYTRDVLKRLTQQAREEVRRLGGNKGVEKILEALVVQETIS